MQGEPINRAACQTGWQLKSALSLSRGLPFNLTTKQLAGVVYVGIALLAAGLVAFEANGLIQWYSTLNNINLRVSNVQFHLDGQPLGFPYLIVAATVFGPERYNDLTLSQLGFNVFVDSTNESFAVQDSSAVAQTVFVTQLEHHDSGGAYFGRYHSSPRLSRPP